MSPPTDNNPQDFPSEKDGEIVELGSSAQSDSVSRQEEIGVQEKDIVRTSGGDREKESLLLKETIQKNEIDDEATVSTRESENPIAENDDGFRTPTSSDNKIPSPTQCPPAPRKSRPLNLKRKESSPESAARRSIQFEEPPEVESIFRPLPDPDNVEERKLKKARREDD